MESYWRRFQHCPVCGFRYGADAWDPDSAAYVCQSCEYRFYQNSKPSATALIPQKGSPDRILLITRATPPETGKLALPGGFLVYGEDPVQAAVRESFEECLLRVTVDRLLCATSFDYAWSEGSVTVLELTYLMQPAELPAVRRLTSEASGVEFYDVHTLAVETDRLAFPAQRGALSQYARSLDRAPRYPADPRARPGVN